jgi:hypothetical protein
MMTYEKVNKNKILNNINKSKFTTSIMSLLISFGLAISIIELFDDREAVGQSTATAVGPLKINVQVTNNGYISETGSIHVISDETGVVKDSNGISFHPGQTVIQSFDFNLEEIPIGTGFSVEVIYGDDYSKRVNDIISQANQPEIIDIVIP